MLRGEDHGECILKVERLSSVLFALGGKKNRKRRMGKIHRDLFWTNRISWWGGGIDEMLNQLTRVAIEPDWGPDWGHGSWGLEGRGNVG